MDYEYENDLNYAMLGYHWMYISLSKVYKLSTSQLW